MSRLLSIRIDGEELVQVRGHVLLAALRAFATSLSVNGHAAAGDLEELVRAIHGACAKPEAADCGHQRPASEASSWDSDNMIRMFTTAETAKLLQLGERTVRRLIANGEIASRKIGGSRRVPAAEIERLAS